MSFLQKLLQPQVFGEIETTFTQYFQNLERKDFVMKSERIRGARDACVHNVQYFVHDVQYLHALQHILTVAPKLVTH
jgi:hypothetical protein